VPALDFETALRPIATIAAFVYRHADDSADQALHGQADTFVFAGQCRKRTAGAPDDDAAEMYLWSMGRLDAAGYRQYEISNVAKPGAESRHNLKYWEDGEWLGFGCGAHSTRDGIRSKNVSATEDYIQRVAEGRALPVETRRLTALERAEEALFTGLRLAGGVDIAAVGTRYGLDAWGRFAPGLAPFIAEGMVLREGNRIRLSREGMLVANEIMAVFV